MLIAGQPPKFAIVRLRPNDDVFRLFRLLVENGYQEVSFVNELKEYSTNRYKTVDGMLLEAAKQQARVASEASKANQAKRQQQFMAQTKTNPSASVTQTPQSGTNLMGQMPRCSTSTAVTPTPLSPFVHSKQSVQPIVPGPKPANTNGQMFQQNTAPMGNGSNGNMSLSIPLLLANNALLEQTLMSQLSAAAAAAACVQQQQMQAQTHTQTKQETVVKQETPNMEASPPVVINQVTEPQANAPKQQPMDLSSSNGVGSSTNLAKSTGTRKENNRRSHGHPGTQQTTKLSHRKPNPHTAGPSAATMESLSDGISDSGPYATCGLCQNRIMASRLSNLTNHVRRHAMLKQFQCCYCEYTHNEMAKVRLHMLHNHKDKDSQPIDNLNPDMQAQWDMLMQQCFPHFAKEKFGVGKVPASSSVLDDSGVSMVRSERLCDTLSDSHSSSNGSVSEPAGNGTVLDSVKTGTRSPDITLHHTCIECGEQVNPSDLLEHISRSHVISHDPFTCAECGHDSADQLSMQLHVDTHHNVNADGEPEPQQATNTDIKATHSPNSTITRYFPDYIPVVNVQPVLNGRTPQEKGLKDVYCKLCHRACAGQQSTESLMQHTRNHYRMKYIKCAECTYSAHDEEHVTKHMLCKHPLSSLTPINTREASSCVNWLDMTAHCFPSVAAKLDRDFVPVKQEPEPELTIETETPKDIQKTKQCQLCSIDVLMSDLEAHALDHSKLDSDKPPSPKRMKTRASEKHNTPTAIYMNMCFENY